ncbi:hypothetical protein Cgig2_002472 [Carnegiea gigantea]|uniref:Uncharacterized protein n=1 Tax=Carnegiea gigantea TaxID=171969 RepID=A0A9Q1QR70_9CARY|nr:hypothetical protein Cgig2_002472 [Carnegiea gigantea]
MGRGDGPGGSRLGFDSLAFPAIESRKRIATNAIPRQSRKLRTCIALASYKSTNVRRTPTGVCRSCQTSRRRSYRRSKLQAMLVKYRAGKSRYVSLSPVWRFSPGDNKVQYIAKDVHLKFAEKTLAGRSVISKEFLGPVKPQSCKSESTFLGSRNGTPG